ncbi:hypothetical protein [Streptomyces sp. NPDC058011]
MTSAVVRTEREAVVRTERSASGGAYEVGGGAGRCSPALWSGR